jgi:NAD-dependent SIR2 family protein deacetylase
MEKQENKIIIISELPEPEKKNSECVYCGTEYLRKENFEDGVPNCPACGGTATTDMEYPNIEIAQVYDYLLSKTFNPYAYQIQEKNFGDFWRTIQKEASNLSN